MAKRLTDITLAEVSCVAAPANKGARTILFKDLAGPTAGEGPAGGGEGPAAPAPPAEARVSKEPTMTDKTAADTAAREAAEKAQADAFAKAVADAVEKAVAPLRERAEAAEKAAADERTARELAALEKRAEAEFGRLPGASVEKAKALAVIGKMGDAERATIEAMLKAGDEALKQLTAGAAAQMGHSGSASAPGSAAEELNKAAADISKAESVSLAKGFDLACQRDPALYGRYMTEHRAARRAA